MDLNFKPLMKQFYVSSFFLLGSDSHFIIVRPCYFNTNARILLFFFAQLKIMILNAILNAGFFSLWRLSMPPWSVFKSQCTCTMNLKSV